MERHANAPGKITPAIARRIHELAASGLSQRAIADRLVSEGAPLISHVAVGRVLKRAPVGGGPVTTTPTKTPATPPPRPSKRQNEAPATNAPPSPAPSPRTSPSPSPESVAAFIRATSEEVIQLEQLDDIAPGTIEQLRRRQRQVGQIADALIDDVYSGAYQATQWKQLIGLEQDLAQRIMRIVPPELPDPETDPHNVQTRDAFVARIAQAVSDLEREPIIRQSMRRHLDDLDARAEAEPVV